MPVEARRSRSCTLGRGGDLVRDPEESRLHLGASVAETEREVWRRPRHRRVRGTAVLVPHAL